MSLESFNDILNRQTELFKQALGDDINLDPSSVSGQLLQLSTQLGSDINQSVFAAISACYITEAKGQALDRLGALINASRRSGKTVVPNVDLTGTPATLIPAGSQAQDDAGNFYESTFDATIGGGGSIPVDFIALVAGDTPVPAATLTTIVTVIAGWDTVNNVQAGITGFDLESDAVFRARFFRFPQQYSLGYGGAIQSTLLAIPDTRDVFIHENRTNVTEGVPYIAPPHSVTVFISYPDVRRNQEIAQGLLETLPPATNFTDAAAGASQESAVVVDASGQNQTFEWTKATETAIKYEVKLAVASDVTQANIDKIKDDLVAFIQRTARIAGTTSHSQSLAAIVCDATFSVASIELARVPDMLSAADLPALYDEIFFLLEGDVNVLLV